ncbi:hypothetical protein D3C81_772590 [compost metagenome]
MEIKTWKEGMSAEESKDIAYWERNQLALQLATVINGWRQAQGEELNCGYYVHEGPDAYEGWSRVISLYDGRMTFHVPDAFDLGHLPRVAPNWDSHSTEEKWKRSMSMCGCFGQGTTDGR